MGTSKGVAKILVIDDETDFLKLLGRIIKKMGLIAMPAENLQQARKVLAQESVSLVLLDMILTDGHGLDFCRELKASHPTLPVIFMTGCADRELAVQAVRLGAHDFLSKPITMSALSVSIRTVLERTTGVPPHPSSAMTIVGESQAMQDVWRQIHAFAGTDITILLLGESGTGKELFARSIHALSKRATGPFVDLDCASLAPTLIESELFGHERGAYTDASTARPGRFELASGGTLFLDEIGNLSLEVQAKLLRVVQERQFRRLGGTRLIDADVRIVGASNMDLATAVAGHTFRGDLYYRIAEVPLRLPPLRERTGDVERLAEHFARTYAIRYNRPIPTLTPELIAHLDALPWPGNVRELENVVRAAILRCGPRMTLEHVPPPPSPSAGPPIDAPFQALPPVPPPPSGSATAAATAPAPALAEGTIHIDIPCPEGQEGLDLKAFQRRVKADVERLILRRLIAQGMNKTQMARYLHLDYKVLLDKLKEHDLEPRAV